MTGIRHILTGAALAAMLAACGPETPQLMNFGAQGPGPDEFAILPNEPLEIPEDLAALPPPTPGGPSRADPDPEADAIVALGGTPGGGVRGGDLVTYASRLGVSPGIRQTLAAEDLDFRRRNDGRILERVFGVNVYYRAYERQSLDQYAELYRLRGLGVRTPAVPPEGAQ